MYISCHACRVTLLDILAAATKHRLVRLRFNKGIRTLLGTSAGGGSSESCVAVLILQTVAKEVTSMRSAMCTQPEGQKVLESLMQL